MKYIFSSILVVLTIILLICAFVIRNNKNELKKTVTGLLYVAAITQLSFASVVFFNTEWIANITYGMYYASIDWLLYMMMEYTEKHTRIFSEIRVVRISIFVYCLLETVSMLLNVVFGHVYQMKLVTFMNQEYWIADNQSFLFTMHLVYTYILVVIIFLCFLNKIIHVPAFYKKKYIPFEICFVIIIASNAFYMVMKSPLDISLIMYALMAIVVCRTSLYTIPDGIINDTFSFVVTDYNDGIMCMDMDDNCIYINSIMSQYLWIPKDDTEKLNERFRKWKEEEPHSADDHYTWEQKEIIDGEERYYEHNYRKLYDKKGHYVGCYFALKDKSVTLEQLRKEKYQMTHDALTGIYTAERFYEAVEERLASDIRNDWLIICSNIRDFKLFSDYYGKQVSNEVLCLQAKLIEENVSSTSVFGRLGEDVFALCMEKSRFDLSLFERNMEKIINAYQDKSYRMEIQIGIYEVKNHTESVPLMCNKADLAIKSIAKQYDKFYAYYDESMMEEALSEKRVISEFENALVNKQFQIYLQPQVSDDGDMVGAKLQVRWMHPQRGLIYGKDFIPYLEKRGLVFKLCMYVWEEAAKILQKWKEQGDTEQVLVMKVFLSDFQYFDVAKELISLMKKYDLDVKNVKLDVTEILWSNQFDDYLDDLKKLQEYGFVMNEVDEVLAIRKKIASISDYEQPVPVKEFEEKYVQ